MPKLKVTKIILTDDRLRALSGKVRQRAGIVVAQAAHQIEREAKFRAPVDTGFLTNSIYTKTTGTSNYEENQAKAKEKDEDGVSLSEVGQPEALSATVAVGAEYGAAVEYGGGSRAATPYLTPAVEKVRPEWEKGLKRLFDE